MQVRARINADLQRPISCLDFPYEIGGFLTQIFTKIQPNNHCTMDHGEMVHLKAIVMAIRISMAKDLAHTEMP